MFDNIIRIVATVPVIIGDTKGTMIGCTSCCLAIGAASLLWLITKWISDEFLLRDMIKPSLVLCASVLLNRTIAPDTSVVQSTSKVSPTNVDTVKREEEQRYQRESMRLFELGLQYHNANRFLEAIAQYSEALKLNKGKLNIMLSRANAYNSLGEAEQAFLDYNSAITSAPMNFEGYRWRALGRLKYRDYLAAISDAEHAVKLAPQSIDALLTLSVVQMEAKRYHDAIATCNIILVRTPLQLDARLNRVSCFLRVGDLEQAATDLANLSPASNDGRYHCRLAELQIALDKKTEARKSLETAIAIGPEDGYSWFKLAELNVSEERYFDAVGSYGQAIRISSNPFFHDAYAQFLLACPEPQCRSSRVAADNAGKACLLTANRVPEFLNTWASCLAEPEVNDLTGAIRAQKLAIELLPQGSELRQGYVQKLAKYTKLLSP